MGDTCIFQQNFTEKIGSLPIYGGDLASMHTKNKHTPPNMYTAVHLYTIKCKYGTEIYSSFTCLEIRGNRVLVAGRTKRQVLWLANKCIMQPLSIPHSKLKQNNKNKKQNKDKNRCSILNVIIHIWQMMYCIMKRIHFSWL